MPLLFFRFSVKFFFLLFFDYRFNVCMYVLVLLRIRFVILFFILLACYFEVLAFSPSVWFNRVCNFTLGLYYFSFFFSFLFFCSDGRVFLFLFSRLDGFLFLLFFFLLLVCKLSLTQLLVVILFSSLNLQALSYFVVYFFLLFCFGTIKINWHTQKLIDWLLMLL